METLVAQSINGIALGGVFALFALGFGLIFGVMRIFNVAHGAVFSWAGLGAYWVAESLDLPIYFAIIGAMVTGGAFSVLLDTAVFRPLRRRKADEITFFVAAMGAGTMLTGIAQVASNSQELRLPFGYFPSIMLQLGAIKISLLQVVMVLVSVLLFVALHFTVTRTRFGRAMRTVAYNQRIASMSGVNVNSLVWKVFFISGAMAGVAALLVSLAFSVVNFYMGEHYMVDAFAIVVLGGYGSIAGTFLGGFVIGILIVLSGAFLSSTYRDVIVFSLIILILILRPSGLVKGGDIHV